MQKRQTKHIKTKKIEHLERMDKAVWFIPPVMTLWLCRGGLLGLFSEGITVGLVTLLLFFLLLGVFYIPVMIIWRAVSRTLKKNAIAQTTFSVLEDFDYYRDELTGISPATISMCVDYEIEREKDLAAQLLKFTMQGLIATEGEQITVLVDEPPEHLSKSERFLLDALRQGKLRDIDASDWADLAYNEVMAGPYLTKKELKKTKKGGPAGCLGCLPFFLIVGITTAVLDSAPVQSVMTAPENLSNAEILALFSQNEQVVLGALYITLLGIAMFCSMALPIALVVWGVITTSANAKNRYQRTEAGEILTEEIYGLKNFLHDFSDLESAQKEALVLWDDFLIYAVVLEENTAIVEEITAMRNLNIITPTYTNE